MGVGDYGGGRGEYAPGMSMLEIENALKSFPTQALQDKLRQPSPQIPPFMIAAELARRESMEKEHAGARAAALTARQAPTVAARLAGMGQRPGPMSRVGSRAAPPPQPPLPVAAQLAMKMSGVTGRPPPELPTVRMREGTQARDNAAKLAYLRQKAERAAALQAGEEPSIGPRGLAAIRAALATRGQRRVYAGHEIPPQRMVTAATGTSGGTVRDLDMVRYQGFPGTGGRGIGRHLPTIDPLFGAHIPDRKLTDHPTLEEPPVLGREFFEGYGAAPHLRRTPEAYYGTPGEEPPVLGRVFEEPPVLGRGFFERYGAAPHLRRTPEAYYGTPGTDDSVTDDSVSVTDALNAYEDTLLERRGLGEGDTEEDKVRWDRFGQVKDSLRKVLENDPELLPDFVNDPDKFMTVHGVPGEEGPGILTKIGEFFTTAYRRPLSPATRASLDEWSGAPAVLESAAQTPPELLVTPAPAAPAAPAVEIAASVALPPSVVEPEPEITTGSLFGVDRVPGRVGAITIADPGAPTVAGGQAAVVAALAGEEIPPAEGMIDIRDVFNDSLKGLSEDTREAYKGMDAALKEMSQLNKADFEKLGESFEALENYYATGKLPEGMKRGRVTSLLLEMSKGFLGNRTLYDAFKAGVEGFQAVDSRKRKEYAEGLSAMLAANQALLNAKMTIRNGELNARQALLRGRRAEALGNHQLAAELMNSATQENERVRTARYRMETLEINRINARTLLNNSFTTTLQKEIAAFAGSDLDRIMAGLRATKDRSDSDPERQGLLREFSQRFVFDSETGKAHPNYHVYAGIVQDVTETPMAQRAFDSQKVTFVTRIDRALAPLLSKRASTDHELWKAIAASAKIPLPKDGRIGPQWFTDNNAALRKAARLYIGGRMAGEVGYTGKMEQWLKDRGYLGQQGGAAQGRGPTKSLEELTTPKTESK